MNAHYDAVKDCYVNDEGRPTFTETMQIAIDARNNTELLIKATTSLIRRVDTLEADRERIAKVLEQVWLNPISISSLQPIMDLARELNPHLR